MHLFNTYTVERPYNNYYIYMYSFYAFEGLLHTSIRLYDMRTAIILIFNNLQIEIDIQLGSLIIDRFIHS